MDGYEQPKIDEGKFRRRATYKVSGFWSGSTVSVTQSTTIIANEVVWLSSDVEWSCGGRDHDEVEDNVEAAGYFACCARMNGN